MTPVLTRAAEALEEVAEGSFEAEISVGRREDGEESRPREAGLLTVRQGPQRWDFRALEVGHLTKERAAQLLSSTDLALQPESEDGSGRRKSKAPLLVSEHVTEGAGRLLRAKRACYLDTAGNCYLRQGPLLVFVRGQEPPEGGSSKRPTRAFNTAGLKLIFVLLAREEAAGWTYRRLSKVAGVSRGAVGYVMEDLGRLGFLEEVEGKRRLRRKPELLERWTQRFAERLRPKLSRGRFGFIDENGQARWRQLELASREAQWGGEPAADLLVGDLRPKRLAVYTQEDTPKICRGLGLAPEEEGPVELLDVFWDPAQLQAGGQGRAQSGPRDVPFEIVPPVLAYADLIAGADPRGVEAARRIREQQLEVE